MQEVLFEHRTLARSSSQFYAFGLAELLLRTIYASTNLIQLCKIMYGEYIFLKVVRFPRTSSFFRNFFYRKKESAERLDIGSKYIIDFIPVDCSCCMFNYSFHISSQYRILDRVLESLIKSENRVYLQFLRKCRLNPMLTIFNNI